MTDESSTNSVNRRSWLRIAGTVGAGGLAGCVGSSPFGGQSETINIGGNFPLSGSFATMGSESARGAEMAVAELKNSDSFNRKINLNMKDNASSPEQGVSNVESFATGNADVVFGSFSSTIGKASSAAAAKNDLPYFELNGFADSISEPGLKNTYHVSARASNYGTAGGELINSIIKPMTDGGIDLAVMHESGVYGNSANDAIHNVANNLGFNIVETIEYDTGTNDLSSAIQRLKNASPNTLYHAGYGGDTQLFWDQAQNQDLYIPFVVGNGTAYNLRSFLEGVGRTTAMGVIDMDAPSFNSAPALAPDAKSIHNRYVQEYGNIPSSLMPLASYTAAYLVTKHVLAEITSYDLDTVEQAALDANVKTGEVGNGWGLKFDKSKHRNQRALVSGMQWQPDNYTNDIWHPEQSDGTLDVYTLSPENGMMDLTKNPGEFLPRPDYTN